MLRNPFENNRAFARFFTDRVAIEATRPNGCIRGTYAASVFPGNQSDPMSELSLESNVGTVTVLLAKFGPDAWNQTFPPHVGDEVTLSTGEKYAVTKCDDMAGEHYQIEARQK